MCKNHKLFGKHLNWKLECSRNLYIMRLKKKKKKKIIGDEGNYKNLKIFKIQSQTLCLK